MADFETSAREFLCDAPPCEVRRLVAGGDHPGGFRGTVYAPGMADQEWFACKSTHIRPAIEYVTTPVHQLPEAVREMTQWKRDLAEERWTAREQIEAWHADGTGIVTPLPTNPVFE